MKALSIRQPWAWAIIEKGKRIENRSRRFNYRGPILLHASSTWDACETVIEEICGERPDVLKLPRGGIVGRARIVGCVDCAGGYWNDPWWAGPWGLVLDDVEPLPFTPCKGALGLFEVDEAILREAA